MADERLDTTATLEGPRLGAWRIEPRGADYDGKLRVRLSREDGAFVDIAVHPAGKQSNALLQTDVGDVTYGATRGIDEATAARLTRSFGKHLARAPQGMLARFPHLASAKLLPGTVDDSLATTSGEVLFDPPGLAELLAPELAVAGDPLGPFTLRSIQLPMTTDGGTGKDCLLLELEHEAGSRIFAEVGRQVTRTYARAGELQVGVRRFGRGHFGDNVVDVDAASLYSRVAVMLRNKLAGRSVRFPQTLAEMRALSVPAEDDTALVAQESADAGADGGELLTRPVLNLAVDAPCDQRCAFCSVLDYQAPVDGGDDELAELELELARARARGVREMRLNGIDPVAFSRVLPLVDMIRSQGFTRMTVFTTGKRFADAGFARQFVDRAPAATTIMIPLYGSTAAVHDAVTGAEGSYALVRGALEVLGGLLSPPGELRLSAVVVDQNVDDIPALLALAGTLDLPIGAHVPYPMRQSVRDPYAESVVQESAMVDRILAQDDSELVGRHVAGLIPHPCVLFAADRRAGHSLFEQREVSGRIGLAGTEYRDPGFVHVGSDRTDGDNAFAVATVPCPHANECALAPICPREQYAVYVQKFGWDEMVPVSPHELYRFGR